MPAKEIKRAIAYAEQNGWRFELSGPRAHPYGKLLCPAECGEHVFVVYGTPRNPQYHANDIRRAVDRHR